MLSILDIRHLKGSKKAQNTTMFYNFFFQNFYCVYGIEGMSIHKEIKTDLILFFISYDVDR